MPSWSERLWNASPASLTRAARQRWRRGTAPLAWHRVQSGPLAGAELCFTDVSQGGWREMVAGTFDSFLYRALAARREVKGAVCWDVGAHFGYHSLGFAALGAQVVAFEPNPHNAHRLRENLARNPGLAARVRVRTEALSNADAALEFVQSADLAETSSGSHLASAVAPSPDYVYENFERVTVTGVRADTLLAADEAPPAVMKIDVEGAEQLVLEGARELLRQHKPLLLLEVHHIRLMHHIPPLLAGLGYRCQLVDEEHAEPSRCFMVAD